MKKIFEKHPMFHYTFVLAVVSLVCGIVIGGVNAVTAPVIDQNLLNAKVEAFEVVLVGIDSFDEVKVTDAYPKTIKSITKGYDASKAVLGYIYEAYNTNSYGDMTIVVSVGLDGKVLGATFVAIEQSLNVPGTRTNLSLYVGSQINNLSPSGDIITGVTGSLATLESLLSDIADAHALTGGAVVVDPLEEAYGEGYVLENDASFAATLTVKSKSTVKLDSSQVGYMYSLSDSAVYYESAEGSIVMEIYFDMDDKIVNVLLPDEDYEHTAGFKKRNLDYLGLFVGLSKDGLQAVVDANSDLKTGATNSKALIDKLFEAFISEVA